MKWKLGWTNRRCILVSLRNSSITMYIFRIPYFLILFLFFFEFGKPKVTVHKCAETIQGRKLYEEIRYLESDPTKLLAFIRMASIETFEYSHGHICLWTNTTTYFEHASAKGQLISKGHFKVFICTKKQTKILNIVPI